MAHTVLSESRGVQPGGDVLGGSPPRARNCLPYGESFHLVAAGQTPLDSILQLQPYALARAFVRGEFYVEGDLPDAIRATAKHTRRGLGSFLAAALARLALWNPQKILQSRARAARNIRFHYDRSNEFYRLFLDPLMVYSCAYFKDPGWSLERAQIEKLRLICRKLDLVPRQRFLDIGCGWGALALHAAAQYGVNATGCTLSRRQFTYAQSLAEQQGMAGRVHFFECDYRDLNGSFDRIASVGMFEHVGRRRLGAYFRKIARLLTPDGVFLNHGILRPETVAPDAETLLLERSVFPGGELVHLSDVCREAERAGFEITDVENLRPHYALTCRAWIDALQRNEAECVRLAGSETYRTWLLFLAGSAVNFEDGYTAVCQMLMQKRDHPRPRRMSRDYIYPPSAPESQLT